MSDQSIFLNALERTAAEREEYLAQACAGNEPLRQEIEGLLAAHERGGTFLDDPAIEQIARQVPAHEQNTLSVALTPNLGPNDATSIDANSATEPDETLSFLQPPTRPGSIGRLAHYEILERVGSGGFGTVLKAFDDRLHRVVAIKVMAIQLASSGTARKRFIREARSAAAVRNDHVVSIHAIEEGNLPYLVMEFVAGQTLQQKLDSTGPLDVKAILRIGHQIAVGLSAAHATGLIHRDIKPANILLENGVERVKITDFGLARTADDASISQSGVVAGTPTYMAPEQARGIHIDHRADLFSLGSVMYAMCTGRPPFRASTILAVLKRVVEEETRPIREINSEIPQWLCDVVTKLHAKDPKDRFENAKEVSDLLSKYLLELQTQGVVTPVQIPQAERRKPSQSGPIPRPAPTRSPWRKRIIWGTTTAFVLMLGLVLATSPKARSPIDRMLGYGTVVVYLEDPTVTLSSTHDPDRLVSGVGYHTLRLKEGTYEFTAATQDGRSKTWSVEVQPGMYQPMGVRTAELQPTPIAVLPIADDWVQLFNGKDLTGWENANWTKVQWKVEDGNLVARGGPASISTNKSFENSHCRIEAKIGRNAWGSLDVRRANEDRGIRTPITTIANRTGGIWKPGAKAKSLFDPDIPAAIAPDTWATIEIIARGTSVTVLVNGTKTCAKAIDLLSEEGCIVLGQANPDGVMMVRKVEIKELELPDQAKDAITLVRKFEGHQGETLNVGISPNGRYALSAGTDNVRLWTFPEGKQLAQFPGWIWGFAFSADGRLAIGGGTGPDAEILIWDLDKRQKVGALKGHTDHVWSVALSPNGKFALSCSKDGTVRYWDLAGRKELKSIPLTISTNCGVAFLPGEQQALVSPLNAEGAIYLIDLQKGTISKHSSTGSSTNGMISVAPDGRHVVSALHNGMIAKCELKSKNVSTFGLTGQAVCRLEYLPDSRHVVSVDMSRVLRLFDSVTGKQLAAIEAHTTVPVNALALSPDGRYALTGGRDFRPKQFAARSQDHSLSLWQLPESVWSTPPLAAAPFDAAKAKEHQDAWAKHLGVDVEIKNSIGMKLRLIPPGEFMMGSTNEDVERFLKEVPEYAHVRIRNEAPQRLVRIDKPAYLGMHEVTVGQFRRFVDATGYKTEDEKSGAGGPAYLGPPEGIQKKPEHTWRHPDAAASDDHPVGQVTWNDAQAFCRWLSDQDKRVYKLPDDQLWEYACRAGTTTAWYFGDDSSQLAKHAWLRALTKEVGSFSANPFGLFDLYGNVEEWCQNQSGAPEARSYRGGYQDKAWDTRSAIRSSLSASESFRRRGFRVAIVGDLKPKPPSPGDLLKDAVLLMNFAKATFYEKDGKKWVRDLSGQDNDGLCEGVEPSDAGHVSGGLSNDGKGFLRIPKQLLRSQGQVTWAGWYRFKAMNEVRMIATQNARYPDVMTPSFLFYVNADGKVHTNVFGGGGWHNHATPTKMVEPDIWTFVAFRFQADDKGMTSVRVWVNDKTHDFSSRTIGGGASQEIVAGGLNGTVDEIALWHRALSDAEVRAVYDWGQSGESLGDGPFTPPIAKAPFNAAQAKEHQKDWAKHLGIEPEITNSVGMKLRVIPPGEFMMGTSVKEIDWLLANAPDLRDKEDWLKDFVRSEGPDRRVTVREPFLLGTHEVTVSEFREFVKATKYKTEAESNGGGKVWNNTLKDWEQAPEAVWSSPKFSLGESHPVVFITSADARAFCEWLSEKDGRKYTVPSEEQWEYACRAGTTTRWFFGDEANAMKEYGWTAENSGNLHQPVGRKLANPFGLFDMHGNACELTISPQNQIIERGGKASDSAERARSAWRFPVKTVSEAHANGGFRVAVVIDLKAKESEKGPAPRELK